MAHKHSKSKHKKKHKKEDHKKHKKEKKSEKKSRKRKRSSSTGSSSSSSDSEKEFAGPTVNREDWNFLDSALSQTNAVSREEKVPKPKENSTYEPRHNPRELNPYWKENGTGLPQTSSSSSKLKNLFLKPGDGAGPTVFAKTYHNNWRKRDPDTKNRIDASSNATHGSGQSQKSEETTNSESRILSNDELNSLAAKLVKAEIMGNKAQVEKLKAQLEEAKRIKVSAHTSEQSKGKCNEVVIIRDNNTQRLMKKYDNKDSSKRQKLNAQNEFLAENSKYSLKNMFLQEKTEEDESEEIMRHGVKVRNLDEFDDVYLDAASSEKSVKKREKKKESKTMHEAIKKHKTLEGCSWCIDNRNDKKHLIVSTGSKCYLCLPETRSLTSLHCFIVPIQHELSTRKLDEDVWEEIKMYQKLLTKMFSEREMDAVFFESARAFRHFPHCYIQCVPIDKETGDLAPIYFQKAISESESEWSNNKKVIDFRNRDLTRSIPKDLPYFAVSFGTEGGFAHLIEDEKLFPRNFAEEVIGGMLDLDPARWRKPMRESFNEQREKALQFVKMWKKYEFNKNFAESSDSDSDSSSSDRNA